MTIPNRPPSSALGRLDDAVRTLCTNPLRIQDRLQATWKQLWPVLSGDTSDIPSDIQEELQLVIACLGELANDCAEISDDEAYSLAMKILQIRDETLWLSECD